MTKVISATCMAGCFWMVAAMPTLAQQPAAQSVRQLNVDAIPKLDTNAIKSVQQLLKDKGFDPGPLDGINGPLTRSSLSAFQEKYGIKSRGEIDNQTLLAIGAIDLALAARRGPGQDE